ncbi:MAG: MopE-related protein [Pseudomonadota bacterium]|nr:MopE-related protein [Pseudomonadota bacterium]
MLLLPLTLACVSVAPSDTDSDSIDTVGDDSGVGPDTPPVDEPPGVTFLDPRQGELFSPSQDVRVEVLTGDDGVLGALSLSWGGDVGAASLPAQPDEEGKATFSIAPLPLGEYTVQVVVTDGAGQTAAAEVAFTVVILDADADGFINDALRGDDCDDGNPDVNPDATEVCDEVDNDCDGRIDESVTLPFYADTDGDGYGDASVRVDQCVATPGWVSDATDCDDTAGDVYPTNAETCDHRDNDCDPDIDEGVLIPYYRDADGDAYGTDTDIVWDCSAPAGYVAPAGDCDDTSSAASPADSEICYDGLDNDCDGTSNDCGLGGTVDLGIADAKLRGEGEDDNVGNSVSAAGDFDGDGLADILVGGPGADGGALGSGAAYVWFGAVSGTQFSSSASVVLLGETTGDGAGYSVAPAGDVDADGYDDVFVGAWSSDLGGADAGAAYLVRGPTAGIRELSAADLVLVGESAGDQAGLSVSAAGDVDGDGQSDVLVGAWGADDGGAYSGAAYLVYGPRWGTVSLGDADATLPGGASGDFAGQSVAGVGDIDGDGYDDVLVGAPGTSSGTGTAYLLFGPLTGRTSLSAADAKLNGEVEDDAAGASVGAAGDVDGDGTPDVLVGAYNYDYGGVDTGAAFLVCGPISGTMGLASADAVLAGEGAGDNAGWSVAGAGDMDGDGKDDVLVGAIREDSGGTRAGAAYLVYGPLASFLELGDADARILGEGTNDFAGASVAGVGDTDGDGKGDVLVGAPYEDAGVSSAAGAAYLVLGTGL